MNFSISLYVPKLFNWPIKIREMDPNAQSGYDCMLSQFRKNILVCRPNFSTIWADIYPIMIFRWFRLSHFVIPVATSYVIRKCPLGQLSLITEFHHYVIFVISSFLQSSLWNFDLQGGTKLALVYIFLASCCDWLVRFSFNSDINVSYAVLPKKNILKSNSLISLGRLTWNTNQL